LSNIVEGFTGLDENGISTCRVLPAADRDIDVQRVQLDTAADAAGLLRRDLPLPISSTES
jgi:hypothetical protein